MAIELTPRASQQTAGFGFQAPVFRMNQGVNAATANPLSRGGMGQPMDMVSESQFGLNPNVLAMADEAARQEFYTGVDELNQFVNKAAEFGIDPSKVDSLPSMLNGSNRSRLATDWLIAPSMYGKERSARISDAKLKRPPL